MLLSESVKRTLADEKKLIFENFKKIISSKYENLIEKLIYDKIHEELQCSLSSVINEEQIEKMTEKQAVMGMDKTGYSTIDKLMLTQALWYLPNFTKSSIKKLLKNNKEIGVSFIEILILEV